MSGFLLGELKEVFVTHVDITQQYKMAAVKSEIYLSNSYMEYQSFYT